MTDDARMTKQMQSKVIRTLVRAAAVCAIVALFLSLIGAYGSQQFGWPWVFLYWFSLIFLGWGLSILVFDPVAYHWLQDRPWLLRWFAGSLALTAPMVGFVMVAQTIMGEPIPARALGWFAFQVAALTFAICGVSMLVRPSSGDPFFTAIGSSVAPPAPSTASAADPGASAVTIASRPAFARRLPEKLMGAEIWALSAEDHYVRVHSSKGNDLVLIRLADAIAEMDGVEGVRVHRSWWVARAGVTQVRKRTEGGVAVLKSGVEAPISRSAMPEVLLLAWV